MKAEIVRFSQLVAEEVSYLSPELILKAKGLPPDARVVHVLPVTKDSLTFYEVLISSESYPDRSISELATIPSLCLMF